MNISITIVAIFVYLGALFIGFKKFKSILKPGFSQEELTKTLQEMCKESSKEPEST